MFMKFTLPNIYHSKNLRFFIAIPVVMMIISLYLSQGLILDSSLSGGESIILANARKRVGRSSSQPSLEQQLTCSKSNRAGRRGPGADNNRLRTRASRTRKAT
jgi:hypothetical protein